jgi:glucarate dehydratase
LDRDKLGKYADLYQSLGGYMYDRDPARPGWFSTVANTRWADPLDAGLVTY